MMTDEKKIRPDSARLMAAVDATWPPAEMSVLNGWTLRRGEGGGKRVSAASGAGDIAEAVAAMQAWVQQPMFRLIPEDRDLDEDLAAQGYSVVDPVTLYAGPVEDLLGTQSHQAACYRCDCRPAILDEIWQAGGIGPARLAIMDRTIGPHAWLLSRAEDSPCGAAFVAVDGDVAMIHAIEVLAPRRRRGAGALLIEGAARFAHVHGATWLGLAVTEANASARALYDRVGMTIAGRYHYRVAPQGVSA